MNAVILALALVSGTADSRPVVLVENAHARCSIVTPGDATATVSRAAKELATYLKRISGADYQWSARTDSTAARASMSD